MILPRKVQLYFAPESEFIFGDLVNLTPAMAHAKIRGKWWDHPDLKVQSESSPIDRHWDWNELEVEMEGRILASEKVALIAGDEDSVQGAMMISSDPVPSVLQPGESGLFLELLFTAPWNRVDLRKDGKPYVVGVGTQLIKWAALFSREKGYLGRLRLDSSPDQVGWYQKRGLQTLGLEPMLYESVEYTPMELSPEAAGHLLKDWEAI